MSAALERVFDVAMSAEVITPDGKSITVPEDGAEDEDHLYARAKHYELSEAGSEAIQIALRIARESENPRAIEVLSGLLKNLSDVNKSLLTLNKDKSEAKAAKGKGGGSAPTIGQAVQNQNIFVGSSKDLNKMLANKNTINNI